MLPVSCKSLMARLLLAVLIETLLVACANPAPAPTTTSTPPTAAPEPPTPTSVPTKVADKDAASTAQPTIKAVELPKTVPLIVASVSMNAHQDKAANLKEFERYMTDAAAQGAHLVVFPEVALQQNPGWGHLSDQPTSEVMAYVNETAEPIPGESTVWLTAKAKQLGIYVIYGMTERGDDGKLYNTSVFLGPEGVLARYRKNGLWDSATGGNEHLFYARGADQGMVVNSPLGKVGLTICIEMYFNYGVNLGAKGVDLMVNVSAWPSESGDLYTQSAETTARACKCWHVVANQVGTVGYERYGHSRIIDADGTVIADTGSDEGMVIAQTGLFIDSGTLPSNRRP